VIARTSLLTLTVCGLLEGITLGVQQPPATQAAPAAPAAPQGPTAAEKYKNIQVLKIRADQLANTMQYFSAALGVQCGFCHVQTTDGWNYESDDRNAKKTTRKMIDMTLKFNAEQSDITLTCATCHHGRGEPERTPPLAQVMTPEEAAAAAARAAQFAARQGGPDAAPAGRGGAPANPPAGAPGAAGRGGPPRPTETADQVIDKFVEAVGGQAALAQAKTRVLKGTVTTRDLVTSPVTIQEKATGEYRVDIDAKQGPIVRVADGKAAWVKAFGNIHDLEGVEAAQVSRPSEFGLPLSFKQRYQTITVGRYGNLDGTETISLAARVSADVTEQMQFERQSGVLRRRLIQTRTPFGNLVETVDYSDYRDAGGIKMPFQIKYTTWNQNSTEKISEARVNVPIADAAFAKQ
jgi:photosynthetic reaction center cytochrome c subunit